jgi:ubiquinone/menaquinone biosynthesis C-methylase UbiE
VTGAVVPADVTTSPGRFRNAAQYYTAGRPRYPALLARRVAEHVGGLAGARVLDLGTGPGFLAIDFSCLAGDVIGVDPEPAMLEEARRNAAADGAAVRFVAGRAETLEPSLAPVRLVTMGRSFHWMDRARTLSVLDLLVEPGGAVALFGDTHPTVPQNAWHVAFAAVCTRYSAHDPAAKQCVREARDHHDAALLESAFGHLERVSVLERRDTRLERFVDRALSYSTVWAGADAPQAGLEDAVREALAPFAVDGVIVEIIEGRATIARRPGEVG